MWYPLKQNITHNGKKYQSIVNDTEVTHRIELLDMDIKLP